MFEPKTKAGKDKTHETLEERKSLTEPTRELKDSIMFDEALALIKRIYLTLDKTDLQQTF